MLTYSYYEAEVKRPTVEEKEEIAEYIKSSNDVVVTASEVTVSAEEQLPEADLAQLEQKWNYSAETSVKILISRLFHYWKQNSRFA